MDSRAGDADLSWAGLSQEPAHDLAEGRIAALKLNEKYSHTDVYAAFFRSVLPCTASLDRDREQALTLREWRFGLLQGIAVVILARLVGGSMLSNELDEGA
jgi:hypothetical protein